MDILLVDPPYTSLKGMPVNLGYNAGLTSLAAFLRKHDFETAVMTGDVIFGKQSRDTFIWGNIIKYASGQLDYQTIVQDKGHPVWGKIMGIIRQANPKVVGISYITPLKYVVERIAGLIKEIDPDIKVIVGSFHPTFCFEEVMRNKDIDFIVLGEGEIPLLHLMRELKNGSPKYENVPGIVYRDKDGQVRGNPSPDLISNLDELPFMARDLVLNCDYSIYNAHMLITARGCPYTCSFCADRRLWRGKVRRRSVENVLQEFELLKKNYRDLIYVDIVDGTFTYDKKYLTSFCHGMIERKLNIPWRCTARYDNLDEKIIDLMRQANCTGLYLGLESGSDRVLRIVDKHIGTEEILKVSKLVYKSGINSATAVLLGLPDENKEDAEQTLKLMKRIKTDIFDVNNYVPLPGTSLYDMMDQDNKQTIDWYKVGYKSLENYFSRNMSRDEFKAYRDEAYRIARNTQIKTILRLGPKMILSRIRQGIKLKSRMNTGIA
jgi:anaerobic magnesium-protoporphyrin IX monomethyl ester cyclase